MEKLPDALKVKVGRCTFLVKNTSSWVVMVLLVAKFPWERVLLLLKNITEPTMCASVIWVMEQFAKELLTKLLIWQCFGNFQWCSFVKTTVMPWELQLNAQPISLIFIKWDSHLICQVPL